MSQCKMFEKIPDHVLAVLKYSKTQEHSLENLQKVLHEYYGCNLKHIDLISVLLSIVTYVNQEIQFQSGYRLDKDKIVTAPITGSMKLGDDIFGPDLDKSFTVKEYLESIINHIVINLSLTNIGWCRNQLYPQPFNETMPSNNKFDNPWQHPEFRDVRFNNMANHMPNGMTMQQAAEMSKYMTDLHYHNNIFGLMNGLYHNKKK